MWSEVFDKLKEVPECTEEEDVLTKIVGRVAVKDYTAEVFGMILSGTPLHLYPRGSRDKTVATMAQRKAERWRTNKQIMTLTLPEAAALYKFWYSLERRDNVGHEFIPDDARVLDILQSEDLLALPDAPAKLKSIYPVTLSRDGSKLKFPNKEVMQRVLEEGHEVLEK